MIKNANKPHNTKRIFFILFSSFFYNYTLIFSNIQSYTLFFLKNAFFIFQRNLHISFKRKRGEFIMMVEDLDGMTQGEKEKYVKKDCV